jgi:hypothetical protein
LIGKNTKENIENHKTNNHEKTIAIHLNAAPDIQGLQPEYRR